MRRPVDLLLISTAVCLWTSAAGAADLSGYAGLVSDYRDRGISWSRGNPAAQGSLTLGHKSGLYADVWASTLGHKAETEIDLSVGYETDLSEHLSFDLWGTYYVYPSDGGSNYLEGNATATATRGPASVSFGVSFAPKQGGTRDDADKRRHNAYAFVEGTYEIPKTPVKLIAGLGREHGAFDQVEHGGKWDWKLGTEVKVAPARLGVTYVGSNADGGDRHALVASAFVEW